MTRDELVKLAAEAIDSNLGDLSDVQTAAAAVVAAIEPVIRQDYKHLSDEYWDSEMRVTAARAEGWRSGMQYAMECAEETTDSFGNLYRIDWLRRMDHELGNY